MNGTGTDPDPLPDERSHDAAAAGWREDGGNAVERTALGTAIGLDERASGGAKTRPFDRVANQPRDGAGELRRGVHLDRGLVAEKGRDDFREVRHVRTEHDRLAVYSRLEDVVSALIDQAAADEDDGRHLKQVRQFA